MTFTPNLGEPESNMKKAARKDAEPQRVCKDFLCDIFASSREMFLLILLPF